MTTSLRISFSIVQNEIVKNFTMTIGYPQQTNKNDTWKQHHRLETINLIKLQKYNRVAPTSVPKYCQTRDGKTKAPFSGHATGLK